MVLNILNSDVKIEKKDVLDGQFSKITNFIPLCFLRSCVFKSVRVKSHEMHMSRLSCW